MLSSDVGAGDITSVLSDMLRGGPTYLPENPDSVQLPTCQKGVSNAEKLSSERG